MAKYSIDLKQGKIHREQEDVVVGIDLGTTNSLVAYVKNGEPVAVKNQNNKRTLVPSVIFFDKNNQAIVGEEAKNKLVLEPHNTIWSVKRLMGKSYRDVKDTSQILGYEIIDDDTESMVKVRVKDKFYSPIELSAEILKYLKIRIEAELGKSVSKAVITVPAYFNDAQRQATRDAGKLAGLDVLRVVNEPTAASLAYGFGNQEAQTIAVYDLGGGTFDISILRIEDGIFEVIATNGDTFLGGDDFDQAILNAWLKEKGLSSGQLAPELLQELRLTAEEAKKHLSAEDHFSKKIGEINCDIRRQDFEKLIGPLVEKTVQCCKQALRDAKMTPAEIDNVVMVGGSTRVPLVKNAVGAFFGKPVFDNIDPDEVVALGAAIQADILAGNQKDLLLLDITPLSLGIETIGGLMDTIIPRNSKVPTKASRQYTTSVDGQKNLKIAVFQGERDLVEHNRKLGEFILKNIPPMPAGLPKIDLQFIIDADGILKVKAKELRSETEQAIEIRPTYGISEEEMGRMLLDSIQNAQNDMTIRGVLEAKNEAQHILLSADKFLQQNEPILSETEKATVQSLAATLRKTVDAADKDAINAGIRDLNEYTTPLAHRAMDHTILEAMKGKKL